MNLSWHPSIQVVSGYNIYRASNANGPFECITDVPLTGNSFIDNNAGDSTIYIVKSVVIATSGNTAVYNESQGITAAADSDILSAAITSNTNGIKIMGTLQNGAGRIVTAMVSAPTGEIVCADQINCSIGGSFNIEYTLPSLTNGTYNVYCYYDAGKPLFRETIDIYKAITMNVGTISFLDENKAALNSLVSGKDVYVSVPVNNIGDVGGDVTVILGLYDSNQKLIKLATEKVILAVGAAKTFETKLALPTISAGCYLKAFVFENMTTMKPLHSATTFFKPIK